ncbi:MAG: IMP cyclohydrolase [Spirochaetales bacterium]
MSSIKNMYRSLTEESFPPKISLTFHDESGDQTVVYEKTAWDIEGERKGLRYGENPDQPAALYRPVNGNLRIGDVDTVQPGRLLASEPELLQSGKHPGKINITDADAALGILRYFARRPACVIIKHNNPCGVALGDTLVEAYRKAYLADRIAAFGGVVAMNGRVDAETAEQIMQSYSEVVVAPDYSAEALDTFRGRKNLRVMRIRDMARLSERTTQRFVDFHSLMDGGLVTQLSFVARELTDELLVPAQTSRKGAEYRIERAPTEAERRDMRFGWQVEAGVTSNSVLFVHDETTVAIGTGEQDRVGVAEIARDKAYRKLRDRLCFVKYAMPFNQLTDADAVSLIETEVRAARGGIAGSVMISDAFFPFRDGVDVGLAEGVTAVLQPGGSLRDWESIEACNEAGATMCFTGQRSFRH